METPVPVSKRILFVAAALFLLTAAITMIYNGVTSQWYKNIKAEITSQPYARTITVDAEGKITVKPDIGLINLSVVSQGLTVKSVTKDSTDKMNKVIEAIKALSVDPKDITSTQYSLYPQYDYRTANPKITGYNLTQEIQVKVRDLTKVDDVLQAGLDAGSNQIGQLTFDIDDTSLVKKQAREKAFTAAKEKAQEMADAAGVKLGRVVTFSEGSSYQPPVFANYKMDMAAGNAVSEAAPSIEPGSKDMSVTVSVTYEIE